MIKRLHIQLMILIAMCLSVLTIQAQAPEAYIITMWSFDEAQRFEDSEPLYAEHNQPLERGVMVMRGGEIDSGGTPGVPFEDFTCGYVYPPTAGIQWDEIRGDEDIRTEDDAQVELAFSTVDWEEISFRFNYRSQNADTFDLSYHLGDGDWKLVANDVVIDGNDEWNSIGVGLADIPDVENRELVVFLVHDIVGDFGNGKFHMDNIAVMGKRISKPNDCPPQVDMITPLTDIAIVLNVDDMLSYTGANGFQFQVADDETPVDQLTITAVTTDPNVINQLGLASVDIGNGIFQLDIGAPHGYAGVANIILRVTDLSGNSSEKSIQYGVIDRPISPTNNLHLGMADASAGVALDANTMIVANDQDQRLSIYRRAQTGMPLATFDVTDNLDLDVENDGTIPPVMIESATQIGNRQFWLGSHSNTERGRRAINPYRLFATEVTGQGANAQLAFIGYYDNLFRDLVVWGDQYGYNFGNVVDRRIRPTDVRGFKIEGFAIAPDGQTAFIGLRTPLVSDDRDNALIVPIQNFASWFNNGNPENSPTFGEPIDFELNGLGIRAMECNANGCIIITGAIDNSNQFALYTWSGSRDSAPVLRNVILDGLPPESVLLNPGDSLASGSTIQIIRDSDDFDWYVSGHSGDDLASNLRLFQSNIITLD